MVRTQVVAGLVICALAAPALALNNRSAVSINGLDTNPCTPASPCRSFGAAIAQTNPGGEIIALDSAGYGPFTVSVTMTISGAPGVHAAITATSSDAIDVSGTGTEVVTLRNLALIGAAGGQGIVVTQTAEVRVLNCLVKDFPSYGITHLSGRLIVDRSTFLDDGFGVSVNGSVVPVQAVISNSLIEKCGNCVAILGAATATITNCVIAGGSNGVDVGSSPLVSGVITAAVIESSTLAYNNVAVLATASGSNNSVIVYLAQDNISFSPTGVSTSGAATVKTFGNNRFEQVTTVGTLSAVALQ